MEWVVAAGVGHASAEECDTLGMTEALRLAGERALAQVTCVVGAPHRILLDGSFNYLRRPEPVQTIVRGDACSLAIAAASIVAKVTRDRYMAGEAEHYPAYEFDSNRGYPAPRHQYALQAYGPTAIHRRSWIFMDSLAWYRTRPRFAETVLQPELFSEAAAEDQWAEEQWD
jgi:ribonuclease HII